MSNEVLDNVIDIIKSKLKNEINIPLNGDVELSALEINSIMFIEIIIALEIAFDFEFDDEKLLFTAFATISSMAEYVASKK